VKIIKSGEKSSAKLAPKLFFYTYYNLMENPCIIYGYYFYPCISASCGCCLGCSCKKYYFPWLLFDCWGLDIIFALWLSTRENIGFMITKLPNYG